VPTSSREWLVLFYRSGFGRLFVPSGLVHLGQRKKAGAIFPALGNLKGSGDFYQEWVLNVF